MKDAVFFVFNTKIYTSIKQSEKKTNSLDPKNEVMFIQKYQQFKARKV